MNLIAAVNSDWGIGYNNKQSIVIPEDRHHFKKLTNGGIIVVGRKTFEDLGGSLSNRKNIVLTRDKGFKANGVISARSVDEVFAIIAEDYTEKADKVFVIGGGSIYNLFLPVCNSAYITKIEASPTSDTFLPNLDESPDWALEDCGKTLESGGVKYSFNRYSRIKS